MHNTYIPQVLTFTKPHVVILDEPTNHLDMGAIEALANALKGFSGGVLVISHDQHFITSVCSGIWSVDNKQVKIFNGDFNQYKKKALDDLTRHAKEAAALKKGKK